MTFIDAAYTYYINEDRIVRKRGFYNPEEQLRPYICIDIAEGEELVLVFFLRFSHKSIKLITWRKPIQIPEIILVKKCQKERNWIKNMKMNNLLIEGLFVWQIIRLEIL